MTVTSIIRIHVSLVPSPQIPRGEGSGDIGAVSRFYGRVTLPQCYAINHVPIASCYAMGCKIAELHSDWLVLNQDSWPCTTLLRDQIQYHMKIEELQSDWLT